MRQTANYEIWGGMSSTNSVFAEERAEDFFMLHITHKQDLVSVGHILHPPFYLYSNFPIKLEFSFFRTLRWPSQPCLYFPLFGNC